MENGFCRTMHAQSQKLQHTSTFICIDRWTRLVLFQAMRSTFKSKYLPFSLTKSCLHCIQGVHTFGNIVINYALSSSHWTFWPPFVFGQIKHKFWQYEKMPFTSPQVFYAIWFALIYLYLIIFFLIYLDKDTIFFKNSKTILKICLLRSIHACFTKLFKTRTITKCD